MSLPLVQPNPSLGIALRILATALFAAMNMFVRLLGDAVPIGQMVFFRSSLALVPLVIYLLVRKQFPHGLRTRHPGGHAVRSICGCVGMFMSFTALQNLPLANATALGFVAPLMLVASAIIFLGERPPRIVFVALGAGFVGILVMLSPAFQGPSWDRATLIGSSAALAGAVVSVMAMTQLKRLTLTETAGSIAFYFAVVCSIAGALSAPFGWVAPSIGGWILLIGTGILGGCAHIAMTEAYARAPASTLAPFDYTAMLWAVGFDIVIFAVWPESMVLLGAALVLSAAATLAVQSRRAR